MPRLAVIVAVADNGVIGKDNSLPWHIPEDLRYFRRITMGKPIVMGRRTFESIGRALPGRTNIVISRDGQFAPPDVLLAASLDEALLLASRLADEQGAGEVVVIGGAQIYHLALPRADRLYITRVHTSVEGDTVLPPVDWTQWVKTSCERHPASDDNPHDFSFVVYDRV